MSNFTEEQLGQALVMAHEAGDSENAKVLASALNDMRQSMKQTADNTAVSAGNIDLERGAPMDVRTAVGAAKKPEDKLATLQKYYPDARIYEDNFVFTDPETNQQTLFNPKGMDLGDVGENLRMGAELIGGAFGGAAGMLGGPAAPVTAPALGAVGAGAGGALYDFIAGKLFPVEDTRNAVEVLGDTAIETGMNFVGGKLGEVAGKMASNLGAKVSRAVKKPIAEVQEASERVGVQLPAGTLSGNRTLQGIEAAAGVAPIGSDIIQKSYQSSIDGMTKFAEDTASRLSDETGETAVGMQIKKGIDNQVNKFKNQASNYYNQLWEKMPKNTRVPLNNTDIELQRITSEFADDPEFESVLGSSKIKGLFDAVTKAQEKGGASVGALKSLRTKIGSEITDNKLLNDVQQGEIRTLYGALSKDIEDAASGMGAPVKYAFDRANNFYRDGAKVIEESFDPLIKRDIPEQVYRSIFGPEVSKLKNYPATQLNKLYKSLDPETQKVVSSEFVRRMGNANAGSQGLSGDTFSPATFMTNWNTMPETAKRVVFKDAGTRSALDDLATISASMKDKSAILNNSNTAGTSLMLQLMMAPLAGFAGGEMTGIGGAAGAAAALSPAAAAKLMTSKPFIKWLTKTASDGTSEKALGANLGRLYAIAEANPEIKNELYQYSTTLRDAPSIKEQASETETETQ